MGNVRGRRGVDVLGRVVELSFEGGGEGALAAHDRARERLALEVVAYFKKYRSHSLQKTKI
jgi:hypothetical protein